MPVPESIPVRFTEDEASYLSARPIRRQPFTLRQLVDMILSGTGKQPHRIREILHAGTFVHNVYRYWWEGLEVDEASLRSLLAEFPDPDPTRFFRSEECVWTRFYDAAEPTPRAVAIEKAEAEMRRWLHRQSFWDFLMDWARGKQPPYLDYSYYHHADIYRAELTATDRALVREAGRRLASRSVRARLGRGRECVRLEFGCPRAVERPSDSISIQG